MVRQTVVFAAVAVLGTGCLWADFSYEQTSRMTGGMMAGAMKVVGVFSKQAREPIRSSVLVKGNRMAQVTDRGTQIIDLDRETITEIDHNRKTYSVITFAQMVEALRQAEARMKSEQGAEQADVSIKASVSETGQSKQIAGVNAREVVLKLEMEGTDKKSGQRGVFMVMTADMWMGQHSGYKEVRDFYQRMAQKLNWTPGGGFMAQGRSEMMRGMADLQKEAAKLEGVPVYQVTKFTLQGAATPEGQEPAQQQPQAQPPQVEQPERPSAGGALGRLGGRLGGLGGLGRRRKSEPEAAPQPKAAPEPAAAPQQGQAAGALMELTTELTGFSNAAIDPSKLEVPAGFKQVESAMLRGLRR